jgi:hypothetical protein
MARRDPNWSQVGPLLPLATLSDSYHGPIVLADKAQEVRWFVRKANKDPVDHVEHRRGEDEEGFLHDEDGKPITDTRKVVPAFWAMAELVK